MNIDIINLSNEDVVSCVTTLIPYGYLPYITIPSCITNFPMTCIDHIFVRLARKEKILNIISVKSYCDISDHLPKFISIKHNRTCCKDEKPITRSFGEKNTAFYVQRMEAKNWDGDYYSKRITVLLRIYQQSFPIVGVSRHGVPYLHPAHEAIRSSLVFTLLAIHGDIFSHPLHTKLIQTNILVVQ